MLVLQVINVSWAYMLLHLISVSLESLNRSLQGSSSVHEMAWWKVSDF